MKLLLFNAYNKTVDKNNITNRLGEGMEIVSFYNIVKEIEEEENIKANLQEKIPSDILSTKTSKYSRYFKEILKGSKISLDYFQTEKNNYEIPLEAKEAVKRLLQLYASKPMKVVRKSQFEHLTYHEMKEIVDCLENLLRAKLKGKTLLLELDKLAFLMKHPLKAAISKLEEESLDELMNDAKLVLSSNAILDLQLNQRDRTVLMKYYNQEIKKLNKGLRRIVEIVKELREEEILQISDEATEKYVHETYTEKTPIHNNVLEEILQEPNEYLEELQNIVGLKTGSDLATILEELETLRETKEDTLHFRLVTDEDADFSQKYTDTEELINEAIEIYQEEKGNNKLS